MAAAVWVISQWSLASTALYWLCLLCCSPCFCCENRPTKQDKEAAFAEFAASMDDQLKQQAVEEDEEAVEAALEREEREGFEQQ